MALCLNVLSTTKFMFLCYILSALRPWFAISLILTESLPACFHFSYLLGWLQLLLNESDLSKTCLHFFIEIKLNIFWLHCPIFIWIHHKQCAYWKGFFYISLMTIGLVINKTVNVKCGELWADIRSQFLSDLRKILLR